MNNKKEERIDDFNDDNNFKDDNGENNKNSFRFSNERDSKGASNAAFNINNMKDNEFEYEEDNKKENEDENNIENNNNSFGFRDSDLKNDNNNINNNQYENNDDNNKNNKNMFKDNLRNSENSDGMNIKNDDDNKFSNLNPYNTDNNKKSNNNNNNMNFIKNPYTSNNSKFNNNFNNNNNNNKFNNNNNNFNNNNNNNFNNNNNNNRNPNGGFGYTPSPNFNKNINQTAAQFIPQEPPLTNKLNTNYNYSSSKPYSDNVFKNSDYDPFYERFEEYPEDSDGFDIDPSKEGTDTSRTAGIQIANTIMGAGILSIPLMMSYLGILIGSIILLFLAVTTIYTVYILMRCHQITGKSGYSMFGKITMGPVGSIIVKIIIIINNMGICKNFRRIFSNYISIFYF